MIERIVIKNFKSLRNVELKLGWLNFLIGANASNEKDPCQLPEFAEATSAIGRA